MNKKEIAQQFTKQTLDPNQPSINFGQVTSMLKEIEQAHTKVQSDMESYLIKHRMLGNAFTDRHSQLESLKEQIGEAERAIDGVVNTAFKIPKVVPLATLLDSYSRGRAVGAVDEPDVGHDNLRRRKRRRDGGGWDCDLVSLSSTQNHCARIAF